MDKCAEIGKHMLRDRLALVVKEVLRVKTPKKVCAWCRRVMCEGEEPITHGICPECSAKEMRIFLGRNRGSRKEGAWKPDNE